MAKKINSAAFVSGLGRHTTKSLGSDIKLNDISKIAKSSSGKISGNEFGKIDGSLNMARAVLQGSGMKFGEKLTVKVIEAGLTGLIDSMNGNPSLTSTTSVSPLGKCQASYTTTHNHTGIPTTGRLKKMLNTPSVEYNEKLLSSSDRDYQEHNKRKNLGLKIGFNQKGICFLMEDTYITVKKFMNFFDEDPRVKKGLEKIKNGITNVYGCSYKSITNFKIINTFEMYNVSVTIHMVKITDITDDVRTLVYEITNNKHQKIVNPIEKKDESKLNKKLRGVKKVIEEQDVEGIKNIVMNELDSRIISESEQIPKIKRGSDFGKLPEDSQLSDPAIMNTENKITLDFKTTLDCNLTDSIQFRDRAKIVESWHRVLTPGSIWDFTMENHYGKGIHLNYLYDLQYGNTEHPSGYIFVMEYIGDRRSSIQRLKDKDMFYGYSPSKLHVDFQHKLCYLSEDKEDKEVPCIYRKKQKEEDFEENSEFENTFCPDRVQKFQADYENIRMSEDSSKDQKEYAMKYDSNILGDGTELLSNIQGAFKREGLDESNLTENDYKFNPTNSPSIGETETNDKTYNGESDLIDFDKDR